MYYYILIEHDPLICDDLQIWATWFEHANRHVAKTKIDAYLVSTVFLGINHQFGSGNPLLFETMVFGPKELDIQERCSTWDKAVIQHQDVISQIKHLMAKGDL